MIDCGYTLLENAKKEWRLFFYFPENKGVAEINADENEAWSSVYL